MVRNGIVAFAAAAALSACTQAPDMAAIEQERSRSVQRHDIAQSLAANGKVLVAGTQSGAVLVSKDTGRTWTRRALGPMSLVGLATCPDGSFIGIDFNHKVWHADGEGAGWKGVSLEKPRTPLAITCDPKGRWWVAGSGAKLAVSTDAGASWTVTDLGEDAQITTLQFVDERFAIALGEFGLVVVSRDGGATWQKGAPIPNEFYPYSALFLDAKRGYVAGIAGQILATQGGGATWSPLENATGASLYRLFLHGGRPYGVGAGGVVARLEGAAFRPVAYPDALPVFLGAGTALPGQPALALGGPGGLVRVIATHP